MFVRLDLGKCGSFTLLYVSAHQLPIRIHQLRGQSRSEREECEGLTCAGSSGSYKSEGFHHHFLANGTWSLHVHKQDSFEFVCRCTGATTHNCGVSPHNLGETKQNRLLLKRMVSAVGLLLINE